MKWLLEIKVGELEHYKNYFSIKDVVESENYKHHKSDFFIVNILNPAVPFRNLRNCYREQWGFYSTPEKAFKKREKIIRKNNLEQGDVAVYLKYISPMSVRSP